MFLLTFLAALSAAPIVCAASATGEIHQQNTSFVLNTTECPGYEVGSVRKTNNGILASLHLAGAECNAFSNDIANLTLEVTYEQKERLHVHIYDTARRQWQIPRDIFPRPVALDDPGLPLSSDLEFEYQTSPFAFWIIRRSNKDVLFDTRPERIPVYPQPFDPSDIYANNSAMTNHNLIFENQYIQLSTALPANASIYGLGEYIASSGFRRNSTYTLQTMWSQGIGDPIDGNTYGNHPVYMEHRYNASTMSSTTHGVFLLSSNGMDILLRDKVLQYRIVGGTLDMYFFSGGAASTPTSVISDYVSAIGTPTLVPYWALGFHLCRWGYKTTQDLSDTIDGMRAANIPLETLWTDIDIYHALRDFTVAPESHPGMIDLIERLHKNNQHFVSILDAAIPLTTNDTDIYYPYTVGKDREVFLKNSDGSDYVGVVWPGACSFPDFLAPNTHDWWTESLTNWSKILPYDGLWLDMNEPNSFCEGSCGSGVDPTTLLDTQYVAPVLTTYPEGYDPAVSGPSGNITVNGTWTFNSSWNSQVARRDLSTSDSTPSLPSKVSEIISRPEDVNVPPYAIHNDNATSGILYVSNGFSNLSVGTVATNATSYGGSMYDLHNTWGYQEEMATYKALLKIHPDKRPFMISRSTFAGAGRVTGHWTGDNYSKWLYLRQIVQGALQFSLFGIPMTGSDTCGFVGNTDEELCNRWMQAAAFIPFYRNHNEIGAIPQEPYRWDSVAEASRIAIAARYRLLPFLYTQMVMASRSGRPPIRALFYEFPTQPELFGVDSQWLISDAVLITPVLTVNVSSVEGYFPGHDGWRDWFTHRTLNASGKITIDAPLGSIPVHIRGGSVLLLHSKPSYTTQEALSHPYGLLVYLSNVTKSAAGEAIIDDGLSLQNSSLDIKFTAEEGKLISDVKEASYTSKQPLGEVTVLGAYPRPKNVWLGEKSLKGKWTYEHDIQRLNVTGVDIPLNEAWQMTWA